MTEPTKKGTPCVVCLKPIGAGMIRAYPYTNVCGGNCFIREALHIGYSDEWGAEEHLPGFGQPS